MFPLFQVYGNDAVTERSLPPNFGVCYFINLLIDKNVVSMVMVKSIVKKHEEKLKDPTKNDVLPFSPAKTILNLFKYQT